MGTIREDVAQAAERIALALSSSGYHADFTPESLWEVDRFFDEHTRDGTPIRNGLLSESLGSRIFALGAYVGEVIRRHVGGEWYGDDSDPRAEINVELRLPDGTVCWPIQRLMKRCKNGAEDGIAAYGCALGLSVGQWKAAATSTPKMKPWWKFW
jgi:hypothetical protein